MIKGRTVTLSAKQPQSPKAVRYGWANDPDINLVSAAGIQHHHQEPRSAPPLAPELEAIAAIGTEDGGAAHACHRSVRAPELPETARPRPDQG